jgi:hypothetical protein
MEDLFIKYHQGQLPVEWHDEVDPNLWREIIAQFHSMKTLLDIECPHIGSDAGNKIQCPTIGVWTAWYAWENGKVGDVTVIYCLLKYLCHSFIAIPSSVGVVQQTIFPAIFIQTLFIMQDVALVVNLR